MRRRAPDGPFVASTATLTVAALLFAAALWSALRIDPPPSIAPSPPGAVLALDGVLPGTQRDSASAATLASDPFNADRTLPGEADGDVAAAPDSAASAPVAEVRLLGTVVRGSNPFALCQLPTDAPRIVHVGEKLGDFTLVSLDQGRATFRARTGAQVEVSLSKPGS
jgi:hypothetical protein